MKRRFLPNLAILPLLFLANSSVAEKKQNSKPETGLSEIALPSEGQKEPTPPPPIESDVSIQTPEVKESETKTEVIEGQVDRVTKVILSKSNVQYSLKKKKYGRLGPHRGGGIVVKSVDPESLLENLQLRKGDVILECLGEKLTGREGMKKLILAARDQSEFHILLRRGELTLKYQYLQ